MYYDSLSYNELEKELSEIKVRYNDFKDRAMSLDMSRGKPSPEQLDVSFEIFNEIANNSGYASNGVDCRNYGGLDGLSETKKLFSKILGVDEALVIVGGNSSLNMMFDTIAQAMTHGFGAEPWCKQEGIKFLCPSPGYDRHFAICEHFGIELITVPNTHEGPNMDIVEELVKDPSVKGMWCVPKYSNPEGITYSDDTVRRIAALKPAAKDFRVFWDNAYAIHFLYEDNDDNLLNVYDECVKCGNENLVIQFTSTSKITFPGAGVAAQAAGPEDILRIKKRLAYQTIGPDKLNQLRHIKAFKSIEDIKAHMKKHADILRPKFEIVLDRFEKEFGGLDIANWTKPKGGYFISLNLPEGCAKRVHTLCKEAGLVLTGAGATFPYGKDPKDSNLRIAPSYPDNKEIALAAELLAISVKIAVIEQVMKK